MTCINKDSESNLCIFLNKRWEVVASRSSDYTKIKGICRKCGRKELTRTKSSYIFPWMICICECGHTFAYEGFTGKTLSVQEFIDKEENGDYDY